MLNIDKSHLLLLQPPYPLISSFGYVRKHIATLLVPNKDGNIDSFPVIGDNCFIDGQVWAEDITPDMDPTEYYFSLECHEGESIDWQKFIEIATKLINHKTDLCLSEIYYDLKDFNVIINNSPQVFNIFIQKTSDGLEYRTSENMAYKHEWGEKNGFNYTVNEDFIRQTVEHLELAPESTIRLLYSNYELDFAKQIQELKNNITKALKKKPKINTGTYPPPPPEHLWPHEWLRITEYIQKSVDPLLISQLTQKQYKSEILKKIKLRFCIDEKDEDAIWNFIVNNNLLPDVPQT